MLSKEYYDNIAWDFLLCKDVWSFSDNIAYGFYLCNVVARVFRQNCTGFFMQCYLEPPGQYCIGFWPVQCYPRVLREDCTELSGASVVWSLIKSCPEPLGQHCIRFSAVQCFPKCIKTILHRIFSYALLPRTSQVLLHEVLTCAELSQKYWDKIAEDSFLCNVVWSLSDNMS